MVHRTTEALDRFLDSGWRPVVFAADCGEDGFCPVCGMIGLEIDFGDCSCPGPTQDDQFEYREIDGVLMARPLPASMQAPSVSSAEETAARTDEPQTVGATVSARRHRHREMSR